MKNPKVIRINLIYEGVLKQTVKYGIGSIRTSLLAKECKISEGSIFYYFKDMKTLIDYCAIRYDRELMQFCVELIQNNKTMSEIWDTLFEHILKEPEGAVYYFDYVNYYGFDPTENNKRSQEFLKIARAMFKGKEHLNDHQTLMLWDYISTQLFYYTTKIYEGYIENTPKEIAYIKKIVFLTYDNI